MDDIERAYERRVPHGKMENILHCRKGHFCEKILSTALEYRSPKSLVTNTTIKRMHILGMPKEALAEANRLKWEIHKAGHNMYEAMRAGNVEAEKAARIEMRKIQSTFIRKFTKKL